jgi:proteasome lid subunit RPN8/RPN11
MLSGLLGSVTALLDELRQARLAGRDARPVAATPPFAPLQRIRLTDGVGRSLFEQYATHRATARGDEETGWLLLGLREPREAVALATLPAGTLRDAGVAHVRFNSTAQAVGSRYVRQGDRKLTILGVVHTHPGSLRHPSSGDLRGDRAWVGHLRGGEGVFGIGTSEAKSSAAPFAVQPKPNVQCLGGLRVSWYALRQGESAYRPLPVDWTLGPDLAAPLHAVWPVLERHAERLERLCQQQAGLRVEPASAAEGPGLLVTVPLAREGSSVRVLLSESGVRYLVEREGKVSAADLDDPLIDRGVYRLLAELARDG